jgi:hypothetical protein
MNSDLVQRICKNFEIDKMYLLFMNQRKIRTVPIVKYILQLIEKVLIGLELKGLQGLSHLLKGFQFINSLLNIYTRLDD